MDKKDLANLADKAGFDVIGGAIYNPDTNYENPLDKYLARFAELVAAKERESCVKVIEQYTGAWDDQGYALAQTIRNKK